MAAASTIPGWLCGMPCGNTREGKDRLRSAPITDPLFRGFGIPNDPRPGSSLSDIRSLEGKGPRTQGEMRVTSHARITLRNTGIEPHPAHVFPTAESLRRLRQCPLPSRGDALFSEQGPGIVVVSCTKLPQPRIHPPGQPPGE
jgi:hypothetical protein